MQIKNFHILKITPSFFLINIVRIKKGVIKGHSSIILKISVVIWMNPENTSKIMTLSVMHLALKRFVLTWELWRLTNVITIKGYWMSFFLRTNFKSPKSYFVSSYLKVRIRKSFWNCKNVYFLRGLKTLPNSPVLLAIFLVFLNYRKSSSHFVSQQK